MKQLKSLVSFFIDGAKDNNYCLGSRVTTKYGSGVVIGGSLHIRYDNTPSGVVHPNEKTLSHNIANPGAWR